MGSCEEDEGKVIGGEGAGRGDFNAETALASIFDGVISSGGAGCVGSGWTKKIVLDRVFGVVFFVSTD